MLGDSNNVNETGRLTVYRTDDGHVNMAVQVRINKFDARYRTAYVLAFELSVTLCSPLAQPDHRWHKYTHK